MIIYLDNLKKSPKSLYYKKIIRSKHKFKCNSYSMDNDNHNITQKIINSPLDKSNENPLYIKEYQTLKRKKNSLYSISKNKYQDKFNKNIIMPYSKLKLIIKIQKFVRGFIVRKKMEKFYINEKTKKNLMKTANPIRIQNKLNLSILDAIKRNSQNQKTFIKLANNRFNERNTVNARNVKNPPNKKNNLIYISKDIVRKKNYSFDFKKESETKNNNKADVNIRNVYQNTENNYNVDKKNENKVSLETELSFSNITNEQQPQNINTICENETNETNENISKIINNNNNINNNNELLENKKEEIIKEININSKVIFKNKRNLVLPDCKSKSYYLSSFQTKENSASDRNYVETNNNVLLDSPRKNTQRSSHGMNNESNINENKIEDKKEEDKNKNCINLSTDYNAKDEFDSDDNYQKNRKNFNLINTNIKQSYNPMLNQRINNQNKILNNNKISNLPNVNNIQSNIYPHGKFSYIINIPKKNEINNNDIFDSIKEEKFTEYDNDLKSSFYDHEDFVIINYDYALNEKKKMENSFKIATVENISITGIPPKKAKLVNALKKVIYKEVKLYIFNYLKELKQEENEMDKSLTMNDSCSYVPQSRIQKNKIIFNYAQINMKYYNNNNNITSYNIKKYNNKNKQNEHNNDAFKEIELFRNKNLDSS